MSPVERSTGHAGRALAVSAAGVIVAMGAAVGLALLANRGSVDVRLGDETFTGQKAERIADEIADRGPILYSDVAGGDRELVLQHLGDDAEEGWLAFAARPPGVPRQCFVQWQPDDEVFRLLDRDGDVNGRCDGSTYPADGEGLPQYPVTVRDGRLDVDINAADRATSTTR